MCKVKLSVLGMCNGMVFERRQMAAGWTTASAHEPRGLAENWTGRPLWVTDAVPQGFCDRTWAGQAC